MLYLTYAMMFLHTFLGVILIGIILLQRGRGGGLVGALGGMGGQSFMGAKAGDVFTKITVVIATIWIVIGCICVLLTSSTKSTAFKEGGSIEEVKKAAPLDGAGAKKDDSELPLPAPGNPPPGKSEENKTEDKTEKGTKPEDKSDPKPDDAASTEKPAATEKPAEKPDTPEKSETSDKPATPEKTDKPTPENPAPKEPEGASKDSPEKKE